MNYFHLNELQILVTTLILLSAFVLLVQVRIKALVGTFVWQSGFLVIATLIQGIGSQETELYISAGLLFILKVLLIPHLLRRMVRRLNVRHNTANIKHPFLLLVGAALLVLFSYHLTLPLQDTTTPLLITTLTVAMAVTLMGALILITHHKAISHVIGFMAMENGIFFAALVLARGMPMIVELGIAFDLLVAAILFGVLFFHLRDSIDSLNVDRLNSLREDVLCP